MNHAGFSVGVARTTASSEQLAPMPPPPPLTFEPQLSPGETHVASHTSRVRVGVPRLKMNGLRCRVYSLRF